MSTSFIFRNLPFFLSSKFAEGHNAEMCWPEHLLPSEGSKVNPVSPTSDLDRISPYTTSRISARQVMRIKKNSIRGLLVDPIPNSLN